MPSLETEVEFRIECVQCDEEVEVESVRLHHGEYVVSVKPCEPCGAARAAAALVAAAERKAQGSAPAAAMAQQVEAIASAPWGQRR